MFSISKTTQFWLFALPASCLVAQLATGTGVLAATAISMAVLFGLGTVVIAGGLRSVIGLLSAIILVRYLLVAIAIKTVLMEAVDSNLRSPITTPVVMALGFGGLFVGTAVQRLLPRPKRAIISDLDKPAAYLSLAVIIFTLGYGATLIGNSGDEIRTGGIYGIAHAMSSFASFAVVPALYFAWASGSKRFLSHPLVLCILGLSVLLGTLSTGKQQAMEPLAFYVALGFIRYGISDKRMWMLASSGLVYYALVIYPYSQYVRDAGGRQGDLTTRMSSAADTFLLMLTDPNYRDFAESKPKQNTSSYLSRPALEPFSRFAMIGDADRLIYATDAQGALTGWETITWGFKLAVPSFIYPSKPIWGTGNFLAHVAGDVGDGDNTTQVSYGIMANFYNAFGLGGVLFGDAIFFAAFYYSIAFWFGNPRISGTGRGGDIWAILIVASYHHMLVEQTLAGAIPAMQLPLMVAVLGFAARGASLFASGLRGPNSPGGRVATQPAPSGQGPRLRRCA